MSIFTDIINWIKGATAKVKQALGFGHDVANWLKGISDSGILDTIVSATPWKIDDVLLPVFKEWLAELVKDLNLVDQTVDGVDETLMLASTKISEMSSDARTIILNGINAASATWHAEEVGNVDLPIQQSLPAAQPVYDNPAILEA